MKKSCRKNLSKKVKGLKIHQEFYTVLNFNFMKS